MINSTISNTPSTSRSHPFSITILSMVQQQVGSIAPQKICIFTPSHPNKKLYFQQLSDISHILDSFVTDPCTMRLQTISLINQTHKDMTNTITQFDLPGLLEEQAGTIIQRIADRIKDEADIEATYNQKHSFRIEVTLSGFPIV